MREIPYHNDKEHAVHVGGKMIPPGETRMVDESMVPNRARKDETKQEAPATDPLLDILDGSVADVKGAVAGMSGDELDKLEAAEQAGKTRKGVLEAIAAARLVLASGDTSAESTDETDPAAAGEGDAGEG